MGLVGSYPGHPTEEHFARSLSGRKTKDRKKKTPLALQKRKCLEDKNLNSRRRSF